MHNVMSNARRVRARISLILLGSGSSPIELQTARPSFRLHPHSPIQPISATLIAITGRQRKLCSAKSFHRSAFFELFSTLLDALLRCLRNCSRLNCLRS
jgi:hypothetical protein